MLFVTMLATFMASVDSDIVTIALPKISGDFSTGFSYLGLVITGYLLALVALVILFGKIADTYGRKRIYIIGFVFFAASSALCGLSQNISELIAFRIIQGASAALFFAVSRPILVDNYPANELSFAFGVNTATSSIGGAIGPVIGGFLVSVDWRLIFYVNVPIAILATAIAIRKIPVGTRKVSPGSGLKSINPLSSILFAIAIGLILTSLTFYNLSFGIAGLVVLVPLLVNEALSRNPLISRELRKNRGYVYTLLAVNALTIGFSGIIFAITFYFQSVISLSPTITGILIAPISLTIAIGSVAAGRIYGRMKSPNNLSIFGALVCGLGIAFLGFAVGIEAPLWLLAALLSAIGVAVGIYWIPLLTTGMKFPRQELVGAASGIWSMFVNLTSAISIAITVAISAHFLPHSLATEVYAGGLVNLTYSQSILFKLGIEYSLIALGVFNLMSIPLILLVIKEQRLARARIEIEKL